MTRALYTISGERIDWDCGGRGTRDGGRWWWCRLSGASGTATDVVMATRLSYSAAVLLLFCQYSDDADDDVIMGALFVEMVVPEGEVLPSPLSAVVLDVTQS